MHAQTKVKVLVFDRSMILLTLQIASDPCWTTIIRP